MAFAFQTIASTNSAAEIIFNLKTVMKANGWTVPSSSNGSTYNASGDAITSIAEMAATNAWFRARQPSGGVAPNAGTREFTFQTLTGTTDIRIKYSLSGGFTGGSPGVLQTPSATDERMVAGAGTDAAPTGGSLNIGGGSPPAFVAVETASPFAWYACHYYVGSSTAMLLGFDPVVQAPYDAATAIESDLDPYAVYYVAGGRLQALSLVNLEQARCHWYSPSEAAFWGLVSCGTWIGVDGAVTFPGGRTVGNPYNLAVDTLPVPWIGAFNNAFVPTILLKNCSGFKGFSKHLKFTELSDATILNGDKLSIVTANDHIMAGNAAFPWNGS